MSTGSTPSSQRDCSTSWFERIWFAPGSQLSELPPSPEDLAQRLLQVLGLAIEIGARIPEHSAGGIRRTATDRLIRR